jgi:hypothetical protein
VLSQERNSKREEEANMKRLAMMSVGLLLLALLGTAGWYLGSPLFLNRTVDESLPFALPVTVAQDAVGQEAVNQEETQNESTPSEEDAASQFPTEGEIETILPPATTPTEPTLVAEVATAETVAEPLPAEAPTALPTGIPTETVTETSIATAAEPTSTNVPKVIGQGHFQDGDSFHKGSGSATLYAGPNGGYLLRFEDFIVTNGPDLHVLLSTNPLPTHHDSLGTYLDLGQLKGNIGSQNYTLPAGSDVGQFKSVVIYCLPFQVIFATATLESESSQR